VCHSIQTLTINIVYDAMKIKMYECVSGRLNEEKISFKWIIYRDGKTYTIIKWT